jgi:hypothetical protein
MSNKNILTSPTKGKPRRCDNIAGKWQPNGDIRFYQMNERKGGVPELVCAHEKNVMPCLIAGHVNHVIIDYDWQDARRRSKEQE